ncbi:MAG TPA: biopolymer transporter ExbD, partial [Pirellulaceae bacterium]
MKIKYRSQEIVEGDLTPMIDMAFQLIAFFMVLLNFGEAEQDERIKLPRSVLAKPPDGPTESPITIQIARDGRAVYDGEYMSLESIRRY